MNVPESVLKTILDGQTLDEPKPVPQPCPNPNPDPEGCPACGRG